MEFANLKAVRERLLGYRLDGLARLSGLGLERLQAIEARDEPLSVLEAEVFARFYGLDSDVLVERPIRIQAGDSVAALPSIEEFRDLSDVTRARVVAAANAARDCVRLRKLIGELDDPRRRYDREAPHLSSPSRRDRLPYQQGAHYAHALRKRLGLGTGPIPSVRDFVFGMPWLTVLYGNLTEEGPAALSFADAVRGQTIVLNLEGKNVNPAVRRFSLVHELCHLLVDWRRVEPLAVLSGYLSESGLAREQRANAFAVHFLCPKNVLKRLDPEGEPSVAAVALGEYGLPYAAIRLYLHNEAGIDLPVTPPVEFIAAGTLGKWIEAERPEGIEEFPLKRVPPERRTSIARAAAVAYSCDLLPRDAFAEALDVPPSEPLEQVLDFFAVNPPSEAVREMTS